MIQGILMCFRCLAPRKQSFPHRSPLNDDVEPGHVFTVAFGVIRSQLSDKQSQSSSCRIALNSYATLVPNSSVVDETLSRTGSHLMSTDIPDHNDIDSGHVTIRSSMDRHHPITENGNASNTNPAKFISLADQYLDTMIMDDAWRAACLRKIRQNKRKQRALKKSNPFSSSTKKSNPKSSSSSSKYPKRPSNTRSKHDLKSKNSPIKSPQRKCNKPTSPRGSDSGFVSSSPTPGPTSYLRARSTRNYPIQQIPNTATTAIPIDTPLSMIGRSCLSCRCTNTTCWRRRFGGIICNSCGLRYNKFRYALANLVFRYKKCGIICADAKCRYIPTRSQIRELKGGRGCGQCYACQGDVIVLGEDVERH